MADYSFLDRLLHRLALGNAAIADFSFDMDQRQVRADPAEIVTRRHVFVSGLARAGTTVLMRRFHATGLYRSLTYRDMPFVLAPNLWRRLTQASQKKGELAERAHGDTIAVSVDSPESLDEVFWRVFAGPSYIKPTHLEPHAPGEQTRSKYVRYVNAILAAQDGAAERYLCKNNNNILRLGAIRQAFPQALLLVPFREPVAHAASLLRQHRNFGEMQAKDPFVRSYMTWLVHHEFGLDHRPFRFGAEEAALPGDPGSLDYWLALWSETYAWLERSAPEDAVFVCYEALCRDPAVWTGLAEMADIEPDLKGQEALRLSESKPESASDAALAERAAALYARLAERARAALP